MIDKYFHLKEKKTTILRELIAGITTFMSMSYIIFIIPVILNQAGMDYNAVYGATIIASALGTLFLACLQMFHMHKALDLG